MFDGGMSEWTVHSKAWAREWELNQQAPFTSMDPALNKTGVRARGRGEVSLACAHASGEWDALCQCPHISNLYVQTLVSLETGSTAPPPANVATFFENMFQVL